MTEHIRLIELNEMENVRITCAKCGFAGKMNIEKAANYKKCPDCGTELYGLHDALIEFKNALRKRKEWKDFKVEMEIPEE